MRELVIDGRAINDAERAYVVAEIGHNHAGDMDKAYQMVQAAAEAGASAVKFQTRHPKDVYSVAEYSRTSDNPQWMDRVYGRHRERLEPSPEEWAWLFDRCRQTGITALSTPFDFKSVDLLESLNVPAYKVASGDATNIPMIEYIADAGKPMILSTGGCSMEDVDRIHQSLTRKGAEFALLQCSCVYPCPPEVMNLRVIETYRRAYPDTVIGLSTHNPDVPSTLAAYTLGGRIFEHHYTNDRAWKGTDNPFSLTQEMLRRLVDGLDEIRLALGVSEKFCTPVEAAPTTERRKKLVAARDIAEAMVITRDDIAIKCPGDGIHPYDIGRVIGRVAARAIEAEKDITMAALAPEKVEA